jgi:hypothetical protein
MMGVTHVLSAALIVLACVLCVASPARAAYCRGKPDPAASPNSNPISDLAPAFVSEVPNGKLYMVQNGDDTIPIVHL